MIYQPDQRWLIKTFQSQPIYFCASLDNNYRGDGGDTCVREFIEICANRRGSCVNKIIDGERTPCKYSDCRLTGNIKACHGPESKENNRIGRGIL